MCFFTTSYDTSETRPGTSVIQRISRNADFNESNNRKKTAKDAQGQKTDNMSSHKQEEEVFFFTVGVRLVFAVKNFEEIEIWARTKLFDRFNFFLFLRILPERLYSSNIALESCLQRKLKRVFQS